MEAPFFYAPSDRMADDLIALPSDESKHAATVLRLKKGDLIVVTDGLGQAWTAGIEKMGKKEVTARVISTHRNLGEPMVRLTLAAGLSTAGKFDTLVQRGTEVGVTRFVPLITDKSRVKIEEPKKAQAKSRRLERVALAAMKQARRSYRPDIAEPQSLTDYLAAVPEEDAKLIFHPTAAGVGLSELTLPEDTRRVTVLIGPEAGFSDQEVELAIGAGFQAVSLGDRILRTETAGPVISALILARLGEFR